MGAALRPFFLQYGIFTFDARHGQVRFCFLILVSRVNLHLILIVIISFSESLFFYFDDVLMILQYKMWFYFDNPAVPEIHFHFYNALR